MWQVYSTWDGHCTLLLFPTTRAHCCQDGNRVMRNEFAVGVQLGQDTLPKC